MVRAGLACQTIFQRFLLVLLHDLLKHGLVVLERTAGQRDLDLVRDEAQHERAGGLDAAIHEDGAEQCLGRIREDGGTLTAAAHFLAVAQTDGLRNADLVRDLVQCALADDSRAQLGQVALGQVGIVREQIARRDKAQHRVAQKLQALVALQMRAVVLIRIGRMGHRQPEKALVLEFIVNFQHFCSFFLWITRKPSCTECFP